MRVRLKRLITIICGTVVLYIFAIRYADTLNDRPRLIRAAQGFVRESLGSWSEPSGEKSTDVWDTRSGSDRILEQIRYVPPLYDEHDNQKVIYVDGGSKHFVSEFGNKEFYRQNCSVKNCALTMSAARQRNADAVVMRQKPPSPEVRKMSKPDQIWIYYVLESPLTFFNSPAANGLFNWTATYRKDSTLVTPYARWVPFDPPVTSPSLDKDFAQGKTKKVAWFVSNCGANNNRLEYARELAKYISVDIIGMCGDTHCPRTTQDCWERLNNDYKFYLAFENSNCRDYITEKFFVNGLGYNVIPIVMGAHPDDYRRVAPPHSYISVEDFEDPKSLAEYLKLLDSDDELYNRYFHWKGTGEFINTKFWCRLCALLNDKNKPTEIKYDLKEWWEGGGVCRLPNDACDCAMYTAARYSTFRE